ncbi:MAG: hypothetical protein QXO30_07155 [Candidatus Caldarchaeum sp.]
MASSAEEFRCGVCGAPVDVSPHSVVVVCGYCGWTSSSGVHEVRPLMVVPEDKGFLRTLLENYVRSRAGSASVLRDVRYLLVPVWVVDVEASTRYSGYRTETRSVRVGSGKNARQQTYRVYVPVEGVLEESLAVAVYGRKFESIFGLGAVKSQALSRAASAVGLEPSLTKGWDVLGSEFTREEVLEAAETRVAEEHRRRLEARTTRLYDCYTTAAAKTASLLLYPVVEARYESHGKSYRLCADGVKDASSVLKAELPITTFGRIVRAVLTAVAVLAAAVASVLLQPLIGSAPSEELQLIMVAGPPAAAAIAAFLGTMSATAVQKIMKTVGETDIRVMR